MRLAFCAYKLALLDWVQIINFGGFNYRLLMHGDNFLIIPILVWGNRINYILNQISQFEDKKVWTDNR